MSDRPCDAARARAPGRIGLGAPTTRRRAVELLVELSDAMERLEKGSVGSVTVRLAGLLAQVAEGQPELTIRSCGPWLQVGPHVLEVPPSVEARLDPLRAALGRADLCGLTFRTPIPAHLLHIWLSAVTDGRRSLSAPVFVEAGLRGLGCVEEGAVASEDPTPAPRVRAEPRRGSGGADLRGSDDEIPLAPPQHHPDLEALASSLGASPTPSRGTHAPAALGEIALVSKAVPVAALAGAARPLGDAEALQPGIEVLQGSGLQTAFETLIEAADVFEHALSGLRSGSEADRRAQMTALGAAGERLEAVGGSRPDLALHAHRIRTRGRPVLAPVALHAACTASLAGVMAQALSFSPAGRRRLVQASLFGVLPMAFAHRPPSPATVADDEALRWCEAAFPYLPRAEPDWLELGKVVAYEHRLGLRHASGEPTHVAARLVAVASAYDALVCSASGGLATSSTEALEILAGNTETCFDPHMVAVLATLVSVYG